MDNFVIDYLQLSFIGRFTLLNLNTRYQINTRTEELKGMKEGSISRKIFLLLEFAFILEIDTFSSIHTS